MYKDLNGSAALQALAGVKYYVQKNGNADEVPYGFTAFKDKVFQSSNTLPLGYTYDSAITRADYEKLSSLEKQQALLQGVVLDSVPTGTNHSVLYGQIPALHHHRRQKCGSRRQKDPCV